MKGPIAIEKMTLEEKRALARRLLLEKRSRTETSTASSGPTGPASANDNDASTYDMFMHGNDKELTEVESFTSWTRAAKAQGIYAFEAPRMGGQKPHVEILRETGETLSALNFSSYNYLGLGQHPSVLDAARDALYRYGLGAASSPVLSGTLPVHVELEREILRYFGLPDRGVTLFSSGYGANLGVVGAVVGPGNHVVMDKSCHISLIEGAKLSGARIHFFRHNDPLDLERILSEITPDRHRTLVCFEGLYSADGDFGKVAELVRVCRRHGALTLVDEAHSALVAGPTGRGVCEEQGVLEEVDFLVMTLSKAFSGVGGALLARSSVTHYVNWYAKCRMFSCALDPAVTGGMAECVRLAGGDYGQRARERIRANADLLRSLLEGNVDLGVSESWVVTVSYRDEAKTMRLNDALQRRGVDCSTMQFPAVPKNEARIRLFVTSEHSEADVRQAASIIIEIAHEFNFARQGRD